MQRKSEIAFEKILGTKEKLVNCDEVDSPCLLGSGSFFCFEGNPPSGDFSSIFTTLGHGLFPFEKLFFFFKILTFITIITI